jgi:hypothetical protein
VFFGALARIDYTDGEPRNIYVTLFAAADVTVHVTPTVKADAVFARHCGTLLRPPFTPARSAANADGDDGNSDANDFDAQSEWRVGDDATANNDDVQDTASTQSDAPTSNEAPLELLPRRFDLTGERVGMRDLCLSHRAPRTRTHCSGMTRCVTSCCLALAGLRSTHSGGSPSPLTARKVPQAHACKQMFI